MTEVAAPVISVIIASYNTRELLSHCLASLYRVPPERSWEVFVIDDASSDGSAEMVRDHFPQVRLILNPENRGYARSNLHSVSIAFGRTFGRGLRKTRSCR